MVNRLQRIATAVVGGMAGAAVGYILLAVVDSIVLAFVRTNGFLFMLEAWAPALIYILAGLITAIIFYIFSPKIIKTLKTMEESLLQIPLAQILFAAIGLIIGLLVALLLTAALRPLPGAFFVTISILLYIFCGYIGVAVAVRPRGGFQTPAWLRGSGAAFAANKARPKVLDTSVIIDGRICDICMTGVMEGELIVPSFVLQELRHIADSADSLKRGRGRRGLDILHRMQKELPMTVRVEEREYEDMAEVDAKLLRLAQDMGGVVVTNDYNLNKVAGVQEVPVFNINELANAIKPVVLPGEEMTVAVIKEGKENGQGVGYLDDGTMIVIEGGKRCIGEEVEVQVTSVLQTAAGRMIFARIK